MARNCGQGFFLHLRITFTLIKEERLQNLDKFGGFCFLTKNCRNFNQLYFKLISLFPFYFVLPSQAFQLLSFLFYHFPINIINLQLFLMCLPYDHILLQHFQIQFLFRYSVLINKIKLLVGGDEDEIFIEISYYAGPSKSTFIEYMLSGCGGLRIGVIVYVLGLEIGLILIFVHPQNSVYKAGAIRWQDYMGKGKVKEIVLLVKIKFTLNILTFTNAARMIFRAQSNSIPPAQIPGNISIISKDNLIPGPSLIQDVWEFDHDPDDQQIWEYIRSKNDHLIKRHSCQEIKERRIGGQKIEDLMNLQKYYYHSEVVGQEDRNEYGLRAILNNQLSKKTGRGREQKQKNEKSLSHLKCIQDRRGCQSLYQQNEESRLIQEGPIPQKKQFALTPEYSYVSRDIQILQRKHMSNLNYLVRQTKEMAFLTRFYLIELEREQTKKNVMKLQIDCRKLRISLRSSSASIIRLHPLNKKQYIISPRNQNNIEPRLKSVCSEREKFLTDKIVKEKKKINDLTTKTSLLSNYYNVIKGKKAEDVIYEQSDTCEDTFGKKDKPKSPNRKFSTWVHDNYEIKKYKQLLHNKLDLIKQSLLQTKQELVQRLSRKQEENKLLRKQIDFIQAQIHKSEESIKVYGGNVNDNNKKSAFFRRKGKCQNNFMFSKSKRKLNCENSEEFDTVDLKQRQLKSLSKIRSHQFLYQKSKNKYGKAKQQKDNENNEYFLNVDSFKMK